MSTYSILVVDDEPDNFDTIEALLSNESYHLYYASSGEQAIATLDKFDPDVILMDVMMPVIDGMETCKRIKLMSQWQDVPIIMVTALSSKEDLARCLAAGADDFLSKPVNGLELRARVNSMLRLKKQQDRVRALSKLQRNNINFLANSLSEIRLDLSVGFPSEFNTPLHEISQNLELSIDCLEKMSIDEAIDLIQSSKKSTSKLQNLTEKFWFYLHLILESSTIDNLEICNPRPIIDRILSKHFNTQILSPDIASLLKDATLVVSQERATWIFREVFEYIFTLYNPEANSLKIDNNIIDNSFHFSVSICSKDRAGDDKMTMADLIQFNPLIDGERDLGIGLKIAKKIVEIYDGIFLISGNFNRLENHQDTQPNTTVYITLPLIPDNISHLTETTKSQPSHYPI